MGDVLDDPAGDARDGWQRWFGALTGDRPGPDLRGSIAASGGVLAVLGIYTLLSAGLDGGGFRTGVAVSSLVLAAGALAIERADIRPSLVPAATAITVVAITAFALSLAFSDGAQRQAQVVLALVAGAVLLALRFVLGAHPAYLGGMLLALWAAFLAASIDVASAFVGLGTGPNTVASVSLVAGCAGVATAYGLHSTATPAPRRRCTQRGRCSSAWGRWCSPS